MSLSARIFIGLALGIIFGIVFGEPMAKVGILGDIFIHLLQMSVLPFVTFSLISGVGRLSYREAFSLAKKCGAILLLLWVIVLTTVTLIPLAFPNWDSASFFSSSLVKDDQEVDFLDLYIPSNPFHALSNTIIPAVVLFSIFSGVALIGVERKQVLLDTLTTILEVLTRITGLVIQLAPLGVFAIAAGAAGTMEMEDLGRLQVYLLTFILACLLLTFWVLPMLVTNLTALSYKEVVFSIRSALITAFATGSLMVILPILTDRGRDLFHKMEMGNEETDSAVEVIVPTAFTFPSIGILLSLSFIPFAAWYVGSSLSWSQFPGFLVSGVISFFGGSIVAMPFLLDYMRLPADMFELFVTVDVFASRFGTLLAAMHVWTITLLGTLALTGQLQFKWKKFLGYIGITAVLAISALGGSRLFFTHVMDPAYTKYRSMVEMDLKGKGVETNILDTPPPPTIGRGPGTSRLDLIIERGSLRVCFVKDALPWAFQNEKGNLVGFDIEMAHHLAEEIGVTLDLVFLGNATFEQEDEALNIGVCDISMTGSDIVPERTRRITHSIPYMETTLAFVVKDYRRAKFTSWEKVENLGNIKIGIVKGQNHYVSLLKGLLPNAKIVEVETPREFFTPQTKELDAMIFVAEAGSAWTVVYPQFSVVVPFPNPVEIPLVYPMPNHEQELVEFVNAWIELVKRDNTIESLVKYWIWGQGAEKKEPRWSVIRNVFGFEGD